MPIPQPAPGPKTDGQHNKTDISYLAVVSVQPSVLHMDAIAVTQSCVVCRSFYPSLLQVGCHSVTFFPVVLTKSCTHPGFCNDALPIAHRLQFRHGNYPTLSLAQNEKFNCCNNLKVVGVWWRWEADSLKRKKKKAWFKKQAIGNCLILIAKITLCGKKLLKHVNLAWSWDEICLVWLFLASRYTRMQASYAQNIPKH